MSKVYVVATAHDAYRQRRFDPDDVVIDPWRMIPDQEGVTVRRLGENRPALISVLVPSRGRPDMLARVVRTALDNATFDRSIEFVVLLDDDDPLRGDYMIALNNIERAHVDRTMLLIEKRMLLSEAWNRCYEFAKGEILMHCGDDLTFNTPGWDQRVRDEFAKIPDRIGLVFADDLSTNFPDLATHGFLHRRWVETVGYFLPPLFSSDWNDVWISEVAKQIGRFVPMPDVVIEHQHHSFGKRDRDETDSEREQRGADDDVVGLYQRTKQDREADMVKLRAAMA